MKNKLLSFILSLCMIIPIALTLGGCGGGHTHTWSNTWTKSTTHHWHACTGCDKTKDKETHDGDICSVCGYEKGTDPNPSIPTVASVRDLKIISVRAGIGSAILVQLPDGKDMLIDSGEGFYYGNADSDIAVDDLVYANVKNRNPITQEFQLEYFVLTNTNEWKTGGASRVFDFHEVKNFYRPDVMSGHADAASLSAEYNYGTSALIESSQQYFDALTFAAAEENCVIKTIDETSCDIDCTFKDSQGNTYNYKIDFMMPLGDTERNGRFENTAMIAIEYKGITTLITGDAKTNLIDAYCNKYGTKYDVDVLVTSYFENTGASVVNYNYAISRSDLRDTNFLEKINLALGEWAIVLPVETSTIGELGTELRDIVGTPTENGGVEHLFCNSEYYDWYSIVTKVTSAGALDVYGIEN